MGSSTENSAFGPTRNPHDPTRVPGGSSGGSAAAVAAGFAPLALGSDTGGSIRQPAALCGVVGMKPTYGRVSRYGLVAFASSLDQIGPFAATVADAALLLDVIAGHDPPRLDLDPRARPTRCRRRSTRASTGLRVGLISELMGEGIAPDVGARVHAAADGARGRRRQGRRGRRCPSTTYGVSAYYLIAPAEASSNLARYDGVRYGLRVDAATTGEMMEATRTAGFGAEVKRRIMLGTYALSAGYYDAYYGKALKVRTLMLRDFAAAYEQFDLLLSPTAPTTAFAIGAKTARSALDVPVGRVHHPEQPGRASRRCRCRSAPATTACRSACSCWPRRWARRRCSALPPCRGRWRRPSMTIITARHRRRLGDRGRSARCTASWRPRPSCSAGAATSSAPSPTPTCVPFVSACPGRCPVLNERAVEYAMRLGRALHCEVRPSVFARKNYFYPGHAQGLSGQPVRPTDQRRRVRSS